MNTLQMNDSKIGLIDFSVKHYCEGKFGMCYIFLLFFVSRLLFSLSLSLPLFLLFFVMWEASFTFLRILLQKWRVDSRNNWGINWNLAGKFQSGFRRNVIGIPGNFHEVVIVCEVLRSYGYIFQPFPVCGMYFFFF